MNYYKWLDKNTSSLKGKTIAISGASGGIGNEICDFLAHLGANIICLDRNAEKSNNLISKLESKYHDLSAQHITIDLEDFERVVDVAEQLKHIDLDYLILNAGAYKIPRHKCRGGYDNVFQINFISPYYLAKELSPQIKIRGGKVVAVSSIAHNYSKIDCNDIDFSNKKASSKVYGNAKRFLTFSLLGLLKDDNVLSIVHPGITFTNITNHYPKLVFMLIKHPMKIIFMKPKKAALNIIYGLFNDIKNTEWVGPRFFNVWGLPKKQKLNTCSQSEKEKICKIAKKIYDETKNKTSLL